MVIDEQKYVVSAFQKHFSAYQEQNIVIYGLGKNTKVLLDAFPDYKIVGLMDGVKTGDSVWGLPVITCEQARDMDVKAIVVLARSSNVSIIYRRIAAQSEAYGIRVYDINGVQLPYKQDTAIISEEYQKSTAEALKKAIDCCDVVSFDIFDTLLVRTTLYPADVFKRVAEKASSRLPSGYDFVKSRVCAERDLYQTMHPKLSDIYQKMQEAGQISAEQAHWLMEAEIAEEFQVLCAREPMRSMVEYALEQGKEVCCTSDMYLPEAILRKLLEKNGFGQLSTIFVSCEYQASKCNGLFDIVKNTFPNKKILHIGDNHHADFEMAKQYGIHDAFELPSVYKMLEDSSLRGVLEHTVSLTDRSTIGSFISKQFNDPFLFAETKGRCRITSCYEMGYCFLEPILAVYVDWMVRQSQKDNIDLLLLGARDGWLISKMCDILRDAGLLNIPYQYFYASRAACTLAGIETAEDVQYAASLAFSGTMEMMLEKRFGLPQELIQTRPCGEDDETYLKRHIPDILKNADIHRRNYLTYCRQLPIENARRIGFIDFVSSGTCQLWLENILNKDMFGFYFVRLYGARKENLNIQALFETKCVYEQQSRIFDNYFFMENVLTSPEPTLKCFDGSGRCVFEQETRSDRALKDLLQIQQGILDAFRNRIIREPGIPSAELADQIAYFVRKEYSVVQMLYFKESMLKDEFCNREFELEKIVRN